MRLVVEAIGIAALVLSLIFVGFEIKQTRDMNLAQLQHDRIALFHSSMLAALESEPTLKYLGSHVYTSENGVVWRPDNLGELERAAALAHAEARLAALETEYRYIEQGFSIREFADLEAELTEIVADEPGIPGVWPLWRYPGDEVNGFFRMMNRVLGE